MLFIYHGWMVKFCFGYTFLFTFVLSSLCEALGCIWCCSICQLKSLWNCHCNSFVCPTFSIGIQLLMISLTDIVLGRWWAYYWGRWGSYNWRRKARRIGSSAQWNGYSTWGATQALHCRERYKAVLMIFFLPLGHAIFPILFVPFPELCLLSTVITT